MRETNGTGFNECEEEEEEAGKKTKTQRDDIEMNCHLKCLFR